jgi:hypothetical protein
MDAAFKGRISDSVLPYPDGLWNRTKYVIWKVISPGYEWGLNTLLWLGVLHHEGRQNFVLGHLAPGVKLDDFLHYIETQQFGNHFVAWTDDDQVISLRRLDGFKYQYHLRVFQDGEVRGHYEYTPEAHPKWHLQEVGFEERRGDFLRFLGDWIIPLETVPARLPVRETVAR